MGSAVLADSGWAFAERVVLGMVVAATALVFFRVRPLAGWLLFRTSRG